MSLKIARLGILLTLCLTLGIAIVSPSAYAQGEDEDPIVKICKGSDRIKFHNRQSGFKLVAKCRGDIEWMISLTPDVILGNSIFLTFTIANGEDMIFDTTFLIDNDSTLAKRELLLKTVNGDKITVTFKPRSSNGDS